MAKKADKQTRGQEERGQRTRGQEDKGQVDSQFYAIIYTGSVNRF